MKSIITILLCFTLFIYLINADCSINPSVVQHDETCTGGEICTNGDYCGTNGICQATTPLGQACSDSRQCSPYSCSGNICKALKFAQTGEACTAASDCSSPKATCPASGVCTTTSCDANSDCKYGQYCAFTKKCANKTPLGGVCTKHDECSQGLACTVNGGTKTCSTPFQTGENATCVADGNFITDCDIGAGLYCDKNSLTCIKAVPNECQICSADSDCTFSNNCVCGGSNVIGFSKGFCKAPRKYDSTCKATLNALYTCANAHSCRISFTFFNQPNTCIFKNCEDEVEALVACNRYSIPPTPAFRFYTNPNIILPNNCTIPKPTTTSGKSDPEPSDPSSSSTLSISSGILLILVLLNLLF